jgi:hypothetical protein
LHGLRTCMYLAVHIAGTHKNLLEHGVQMRTRLICKEKDVVRTGEFVTHCAYIYKCNRNKISV